MSSYTQIKKAVSVKEAAEHYGLSVSNNQANCPFHEDHESNLMMSDDYYFCSHCHAHGDVVNFVAKLQKVSHWKAVQCIATDFRLLPKHFANSEEAAEDSESDRETNGIDPEDEDDYDLDFFQDIDLAVFRNDAALVEKTLQGYEWLLEDWLEDYVPIFADEPWDPRYAHAREMLPKVKFLLDSLTTSSFLERYGLVMSLMDDNTILDLREFTAKELGKRYEGTEKKESE